MIHNNLILKDMNRAQAEEEAKRIASEMSSPNNMIGDSISVYDFCYGSAMAMYEAMRSKNRQTEKDSEIRRINREIAELNIEHDKFRLNEKKELYGKEKKLIDDFNLNLMGINNLISSIRDELKAYNTRLFSELSDKEREEKNDLTTRIGNLKANRNSLDEKFHSDMAREKRESSLIIAGHAIDVKRRIHELEQRKNDILDTNWEGEA